MINVKEQVYQAIQGISENVSDGYPEEWETFPAISYIEEANTVFDWVSDVNGDFHEMSSELRYRIDVWDRVSTSTTVLAIDTAVSALGLRRTMCTDVEDPSGLKHKVMRYEGVMNIEDQRIYQRNL